MIVHNYKEYKRLVYQLMELCELSLKEACETIKKLR